MMIVMIVNGLSDWEDIRTLNCTIKRYYFRSNHMHTNCELSRSSCDKQGLIFTIQNMQCFLKKTLHVLKSYNTTSGHALVS